jgi:hypothetical protein
LNVSHFSTLINRGEAWCNFSAYMGCSEAHPNNTVYIDLRFLDARNLSYSSQAVGMKIIRFFSVNYIYFFHLALNGHKKAFQFESAIGPIPQYTRVISIRIGATINETMIKNISQYCAIDEVKVFIFQKSKKTYLN